MLGVTWQLQSLVQGPCAHWISQKNLSGRAADRSRWKDGRVGIHDFKLLIRAAAGPQDAREQFQEPRVTTSASRVVC